MDTKRKPGRSDYTKHPSKKWSVGGNSRYRKSDGRWRRKPSTQEAKKRKVRCLRSRRNRRQGDLSVTACHEGFIGGEGFDVNPRPQPHPTLEKRWLELCLNADFD